MGKRERARKSSAERTRMRRRSKQNKSSMVCISLIVLMLVGVMSVQIVSVYGRNQSYQAQEEELQVGYVGRGALHDYNGIVCIL